MTYFEENLKKRILEKISEDELNKKLKEKIEEFEGLISEESALIAIAQDLGINYDYNDEYLVGRVSKIIPYKWFETVKGKKGRVAKIEIIDRNNKKHTIVLWHRESEKADKLRINDIIRIKYEDLEKKENEFHLKYGGKIQKSIDESEEIPKVKENIKRIFEITPEDKEEFNTYGKILTVFPKNDKYLRMIIYDGIPIYVTIFNRFKDYNYKPGDIIKLENVKLFKKEDGSISLSLYDNGRILFEKPKNFEIKEIFIRKNIDEIKSEGYYEIKGAITWIKKTKNPLKFTICDGTGQINATFFGEFNFIKGEEYIFKGIIKKIEEYFDFRINIIEKVNHYKEMEKY